MPTQPSLSLTALSPTSFSASVTGSDAGSSNQIYYRDVASGNHPDIAGPAISGDGSATVGLLNTNGQYMAWCVSSAGGSLSTPAISFVSLSPAATTLLQAALLKFQSSPAVAALFPGGAFANEVPETYEGVAPAPPWCIMENRQTRFEWVQSSLFYEVSTLRLTLFAPGAALLEQCLAALRSAFDWSVLTFADANSSSTYVQPLRFDVASEPVRYRDGSLIYTADLDYECWVNRTGNFAT